MHKNLRTLILLHKDSKKLTQKSSCWKTSILLHSAPCSMLCQAQLDNRNQNPTALSPDWPSIFGHLHFPANNHFSLCMLQAGCKTFTAWKTSRQPQDLTHWVTKINTRGAAQLQSSDSSEEEEAHLCCQLDSMLGAWTPLFDVQQKFKRLIKYFNTYSNTHSSYKP